MAKPSTDKLSRAGFTAPVRFVGLTDTAIDALGNTIECPECGTCALCGESLRYVVHFVDANGCAFDAGSNCAKWAQLSADEKKSVAAAKREAAALAKAERAEPGYIARKIAAKAASDAKWLADGLARLTGRREELRALESKISHLGTQSERARIEGDDYLADLVNESVARMREELTKLIAIIAHLSGRYECA